MTVVLRACLWLAHGKPSKWLTWQTVVESDGACVLGNSRFDMITAPGYIVKRFVLLMIYWAHWSECHWRYAFDSI